MKTILVTGAAGQLGLTIQELAADYPGFHFDFKKRSDLDITDRHQVAEVFLDNRYDVCINCAAYTNVEQAEKEPQKAFKVNGEGVKNLALTCLEHNTVLIHISTDYVFDGEKNAPYEVDDHPNPINEYGKSKLEGERHIQSILNNFFIVRTSWLYSKKYGKNFYRTILAKAQESEPIKVTNEQMGCPTNTEALAKFLMEGLLTEQKKYGIYHFSGNQAMTWFDFAKRILQEEYLLDSVKLVPDKNYRTFAKRPKNSVLSLHIN